jgi:hypothetical protein
MRFKRIVLFITLACSVALCAQQTQPQAATVEPVKATPAESAPAPASAPATAPSATSNEKIVLKDGSDIHLKFAEAITSKTATEGDTINLLLDEDIKVGDVVVVKAGAKAVGTITHAKKAGMMGKAGELNMRLDYLKIGDDRVKIRGSKGKEGEGKEGTAVALTVLFGPIGLIKHGKNVEVKEGTPLAAFMDQDYAVLAAK